MEQTQGSEPSQYLEEKKTTSDSASSGERTRNSLNRAIRKESPGLQDHKNKHVVGETGQQACSNEGLQSVKRTAWEGRPKRVTAPYLKMH